MYSRVFIRVNTFLFDLLSGISIVLALETLLVKGFYFEMPLFLYPAVVIAYVAIIILYIWWVISKILRRDHHLRRHIPDIILAALIIMTILPFRPGGILIAFRIIFLLCTTFLQHRGFSLFFAQIRLTPSRLLILSFSTVIAVGLMLLMLPAATVDHRGAGFIDALFTATSATCVTGLTVRDTGSYFTLFGQCVILILIQVGGLGLMTFSTIFTILLGKRIGILQEDQIRGIFDQNITVNIYKLIKRIMLITIAFESFGALLLWVKLLPGRPVQKAMFDAVFHTISAFCNAGFSLNADSLTRYVNDPYINAVFMILIVSGGIGFVVINDLLHNMIHGNPFSIKWVRLAPHTKIVLITTGSLIISGTVIIFFFEFDNTMLNLTTAGKLLAAGFQSVTLRTAGFNTLDISGFKDVTLFLCILFMFIGASPFSTGGGIKTTTFAVLILSVRSLLLARNKVEVFQRTIPTQTIYKSVAIFLFSSFFLIVFTVFLLETQKMNFLNILFEATSAMGTVGLSTGITPFLSAFGKLCLSVLMLIGRVGPLTVALALREVKKINVEYPTTEISVG